MFVCKCAVYLMCKSWAKTIELISIGDRRTTGFTKPNKTFSNYVLV